MQFLAAGVQMLATSDKEANLREAEGWIRRAHAEGARLVVLPEVFNWRGRGKDTAANAEPVPGPSTERNERLGSRARVVPAGRVDPGGPPTRRAGPTTPACSSAREPGSSPSTGKSTCSMSISRAKRQSANPSFAGRAMLSWWRTPLLCPMGLSVCYDLRFPELYRRLTAAGARIIFVPSVFTVPHGPGALGNPVARPRHREPDLHHCPGPDRRPSRQHVGLRTLHDRRSMGQGHRARPIPSRAWCWPTINLDYLEDVRRRLPALDHRKAFLNGAP